MNFSEFVATVEDRDYVRANRLLLKWLSDDDERAALYDFLRIHRPVLKFQSRADTKSRAADPGDSQFHQDVYLLTTRGDIEKALTDTVHFGNSPYQALGSGNFMLGLDEDNPNSQNDNFENHKLQREFASAYLRHIGHPPGRGRGDKDTEQAFAAYLLGIGSRVKPKNDNPEANQMFLAYLHYVDTQTVLALCSVAFMAAAALPLKQRQFDLVELAEQAALRFVGFLFGFAQADHPLIETTMRAAYLGLNYQILGRHFVTQPGVIPDANLKMGALLKRVAELIDLYGEKIGREAADDYDAIENELKELRNYKDARGLKPLAGFVPILRRIGQKDDSKQKCEYTGTELAVIVVGLIAGTIGNVQASVSIAINEFFDQPDRFETVREVAKQLCDSVRPKDAVRDAAGKAWLGDSVADKKLQQLVSEALRLNPPVAFLPRRTKKQVTLGTKILEKDRIVILAMGAATRFGLGNSGQFNFDGTYQDPLIFGGPPEPSDYVHQCVGQYLVMPLIKYIVMEVLVLPGLTESLDPRTGEPFRLEKLWGFNCQKYLLEFDRFELLKQSSLNVVMKVKMPVSEHAEKLKMVIKYGAPRIEKKLRDANHVHFAWFEFLENDTKLALHTVYDRDFDSYIEHFALDIGPLFDLLFEHIQDAPPRPVDKFPKEFVDTIRRYNARPAGDYFFSAYPKAEVSMITNQIKEKNA